MQPREPQLLALALAPTALLTGDEANEPIQRLLLRIIGLLLLAQRSLVHMLLPYLDLDHLLLPLLTQEVIVLERDELSALLLDRAEGSGSHGRCVQATGRLLVAGRRVAVIQDRELTLRRRLFLVVFWCPFAQ